MSVLTLLLWSVLAGVVEGRIVTPDGSPVPGAEVTVEGLAARDVTGPEGRFRLADVPAGRWTVIVRAPGAEERRIVVRVTDDAPVRIDVEVRTERVDPPAAAALGGVVRDGSTLTPVPQALVEIVDAGRRVVTGSDGRFSFTLEAGTWTLRATAPGYRPFARTVQVGGSLETVDLLLDIQPLPVPGMSVGGARPPAIERSAGIASPSARVVDSTFVRLSPTTVERDLFRAIQNVPSVTPASDFSTALYVRGGTPDQTRIFLDGTPIYNPFHLSGFASAFNPEAVDAAVLSPGALPASAPSSLAGVLEVRTRLPHADSVRIAGGLGLLSSSVTVDGPLRGSTRFLVSARRTYVDLATDAAAALGLIDEGVPYGFDDVLTKVRWDLRRGGSLTFSGYLDREGFETEGAADQESAEASWGSDAVAVRGTVPVGRNVLVDAGVGTSAFGVDLRETGPFEHADPATRTDASADLRTVVADAGIVADLGTHQLFAGVRWERTSVEHDVGPDSTFAEYVSPLALDGRFGAAALWLRDRWRAGGEWTLDAGLRVERPVGRSWQLLPRGRVEKTLSRGTSVALAGGAYVQDWWSLRNEEAGWTAVVGYDLLSPVPRGRPLPTSWDVAAELRTRIGPWGLRLDLFHKDLADVPTALPSLDPVDERVVLDPDSVRLGDGRVDGVEISAAGRLGVTSLAAAYRWQREERALDGVSFVPRTDRRHRLVLSAARPFWGERELALSVTWMSGMPVTPVRAVLPGVVDVGPDGRPTHGPSEGRLLFGAPNTARLPSYLRVDLESRGAWDLTLFGRRGFIEPYVSVLNVLNEHNALFAEHDTDGTRILRETGAQLPLLPHIGLRWRF